VEIEHDETDTEYRCGVVVGAPVQTRDGTLIDDEILDEEVDEAVDYAAGNIEDALDELDEPFLDVCGQIVSELRSRLRNEYPERGYRVRINGTSAPRAFAATNSRNSVWIRVEPRERTRGTRTHTRARGRRTEDEGADEPVHAASMRRAPGE